MSQSTSHAKFIFFGIVVVLVPIAIALGLAELGLRWYFSNHTVYDVEMTRYANNLKKQSSDPRIGHEHVPGSSMHVMDSDVAINSDGFRDDEYEVPRSDKKRIIFLGDSLTFGWGVEKEESFEHLIEAKLNQSTPTEIINFGTGNYNTSQEVNLFIAKGLKYKPDEVVLFYFINDAEPTPERSPYAWLSHIRVITFFWSRIKALMARQQPEDSFETYYAKLYTDKNPGWLQAKRALAELKAVCEQYGIDLKVVILPELHELQNYTFTNEQALLAEFLDEQGIQFIDLAPSFSNVADPQGLWVSLDDAHPNAQAHEMIAEYSFKFLSER